MRVEEGACVSRGVREGVGGACVWETSVCTRADVVAMHGCVRAEEGAWVSRRVTVTLRITITPTVHAGKPPHVLMVRIPWGKHAVA